MGEIFHKGRRFAGRYNQDGSAIRLTTQKLGTKTYRGENADTPLCNIKAIGIREPQFSADSDGGNFEPVFGKERRRRNHHAYIRGADAGFFKGFPCRRYR